MVALMVVPIRAATTMNATTSGMRRSAGSKAGSRRSTDVAASASSAFPVAMPAGTHSGASVPRLATNAASQIAGQSERPQRSRAAMAIPVGAHTVVTCSATNASWNPSLAAITYATATASPVPIMRRRSTGGVGRTIITLSSNDQFNLPGAGGSSRCAEAADFQNSCTSGLRESRHTRPADRGESREAAKGPDCPQRPGRCSEDDDRKFAVGRTNSR
jgi:hypothetical protein